MKVKSYYVDDIKDMFEFNDNDGIYYKHFKNYTVRWKSWNNEIDILRKDGMLRQISETLPKELLIFIAKLLKKNAIELEAENEQ